MPSTSNGISLTDAGETGRSPMSSRYSETSIEPTGIGVVDAGDLGAERLGEPHAATLEADQSDAVEAAVALDDLVRHPGDGPAHVVRPEDLLAACSHGCSCRTGLTGPASRSTAEHIATVRRAR